MAKRVSTRKEGKGCKKLMRLNMIMNPEEQATLQRAGYSVQILLLPEVVVRAITEEGLSADALRNKYKGNDAMYQTILYWTHKRIFWEALSHRDIEVPLQQGITYLQMLLKKNQSMGARTRAHLLDIQQNILPGMLSALYKRWEEESFDEVAYRGLFTIGASDIVAAVLDTMTTAILCKKQAYYQQHDRIAFSSDAAFFHLDPTDDYLWHLTSTNLNDSARVRTVENREIAAANFATVWVDAIADTLLSQRRRPGDKTLALKICIPPYRATDDTSFRFSDHVIPNMPIESDVECIVIGVGTGFMPIPLYLLDASSIAMPSPSPPPLPKYRKGDEEEEEEEGEEVHRLQHALGGCCNEEDYKKFVERQYFNILMDLPYQEEEEEEEKKNS